MYITGCFGENIDDYWNVDGNRELSDTWTGFTRFTVLDENPPDGYTWSERRLTRKQTTSRPDTLWPEIWKDMRKELRGIYFVDPDDGEFKDIMKNARRKLEVPMLAAMLSKGLNVISTGKPIALKRSARQNTLVLLKADDSTRKRMESSFHKDHEDHIAGKGVNSLSHKQQSCAQIYSYASSKMKIPEAKAAVDR